MDNIGEIGKKIKDNAEKQRKKLLDDIEEQVSDVVREAVEDETAAVKKKIDILNSEIQKLQCMVDKLGIDDITDTSLIIMIRQLTENILRVEQHVQNCVEINEVVRASNEGIDSIHDYMEELMPSVRKIQSKMNEMEEVSEVTKNIQQSVREGFSSYETKYLELMAKQEKCIHLITRGKIALVIAFFVLLILSFF